MLAFWLLFFSSRAFGASTFEEAENSRCHWRYTSDHHRESLNGTSYFTTYPTTGSWTIDGMWAYSAASELAEANATASWEGSQLTVNIQVDLLRGFVTYWLTGDVSKELLMKLHRIPKLSRVVRLISGAKFSECFALRVKVDRNFLERFLEQARLIRERGFEHLRYSPRCYVDGVEGYRHGEACYNANDYTIMGVMFPAGFIKFSGYEEWMGPLDPRPKCANLVENPRWAAPALQFMTEALPDSDFKSGAQQLIAHMSGAEQQDDGVMSIPTVVGVLAGVSLISVIAGFVIGQRSQAHNMDSYQRVNA